MSGVVNQKARLGQENGPEVDLIVTGTELYATYETPDGYPAIYDAERGLFCYARVINGRFESTGIPVTSRPPPDAERHARESDAVRQARIDERQIQIERRAQGKSERK